MRNIFDMQLEELRRELTYMGALCEMAIGNVAEGLVEGNFDLARKTIIADENIDRKEREIETMCLKMLLQQQPVASDLRQISAALKMITDMERIGDQASDIADIILMENVSTKGGTTDINEMAKATINMVNKSIEAYVNKDMELAKKVMEMDDIVDNYFDIVKNEIITLIEEKNIEGELAIDLLMIAKYFERIGDHATNIAEWVIFSITGEHKSLTNKEEK